MEMEVVTAMVGSLGFPIVAYFVQTFQTNKTLDGVKEAITNNTIAINSLVDKNEGGK